MDDDSKSARATVPDASGERIEKHQPSYWKRVVKSYEKRNASLERRRDALVERVHFMECALPSLLVGAAVVNTKRRMPEQCSKVSRQETSLGT